MRRFRSWPIVIIIASPPDASPAIGEDRHDTSLVLPSAAAVRCLCPHNAAVCLHVALSRPGEPRRATTDVCRPQAVFGVIAGNLSLTARALPGWEWPWASSRSGSAPGRHFGSPARSPAIRQVRHSPLLAWPMMRERAAGLCFFGHGGRWRWLSFIRRRPLLARNPVSS